MFNYALNAVSYSSWVEENCFVCEYCIIWLQSHCIYFHIYICMNNTDVQVFKYYEYYCTLIPVAYSTVLIVCTTVSVYYLIVQYWIMVLLYSILDLVIELLSCTIWIPNTLFKIVFMYLARDTHLFEYLLQWMMI